ncbi:chaperone protein [Ophiocordyceps sinensis CO18]|uniref:Chaperone protein n=1 Tax=Ophiocordyceps sinensis (strain Co18 / CGMCC 3.14243) TaxID=911162 RepID=T5ACA9_OPHSC|nr:chaperone protein [Ophiocordyceps sinensis CO18]
MAPTAFTVDYYNVLGVAFAADQASIKAAYRRLALLKHPDKNGNSKKATTDFQELLDAYSTLSDPNQRKLFDLQYPSIRTQSAQAGRDKNEHGTSQTKSTSPQTNEEQEMEQLNREIKWMCTHQKKLELDLFDLQEVIKQKSSTLSRLESETTKEAKEDAYRKTWMGYFFQAQLTAAEKEERNRRASGRMTGQRVVETQLHNCNVKMASIRSQLDVLRESIRGKQIQRMSIWQRQMAAKANAEQRARAEELRKQETARREREEQLRRAREAETRRREEEASKKRAENLRAERERAEAKKAREERHRQYERERAEAKKAHEEWQRLYERERERAEAREERRRQYEREREQEEPDSEEESENGQRGQKARGFEHRNGAGTKKTTARTGGATSTTKCKHRGWWQRIDGRSLCEHCGVWQSKFALRCPGCQVMACASCRKVMKR